MPKPPRIIDVVKFIVRHRKGKVFRNWSVTVITEIFAQAFAEGRAAYTLDDKGCITGVALVEVVGLNRVHIKGVLTTNTEALKKLLQKCLRWYGDRIITATRHGREVVYNLPRLTDKLCNLNSI